MKDEMKKHSSNEYYKAVWFYDFLAWGKSRRKANNQMRRIARRRMNHELRNMVIDEMQ